MTLLLSSIEGLMGLKDEHSALLFNEGFLLESRYRVGNPLNEGFLKPDYMGEALILPTFQQMRYVVTNQCWKPMSYSEGYPHSSRVGRRSENSSFQFFFYHKLISTFQHSSTFQAL